MIMKMRVLKKKLLLALSINLKKQLTGPLEVELQLTTRCDLNCLPCFNFPKRIFDFDYSLIPALFREFDKLGISRVLLAGQRNILLYPHITELVNEASHHNFKLGAILNNLSFTKKSLHPLNCFDFFHVSLLACSRKTFEAVHPGIDYSRFNESIKVLKQLREKVIRFNVTLFEQNYRDIPDFLKLAKAFELQVYFNMAVTSHKPQLEIRDKRELKRMISNVYTKGVKTNLTALVETSLKGVLPPCYLGYWQASISITGNVYFCCRNPVVLGNIKHKTFSEIWYSKSYDRYRHQRFKKSKGCQECLFRHINQRLSLLDLKHSLLP